MPTRQIFLSTLRQVCPDTEGPIKYGISHPCFQYPDSVTNHYPNSTLLYPSTNEQDVSSTHKESSSAIDMSSHSSYRESNKRIHTTPQRHRNQRYRISARFVNTSQRCRRRKTRASVLTVQKQLLACEPAKHLACKARSQYQGLSNIRLNRWDKPFYVR